MKSIINIALFVGLFFNITNAHSYSSNPKDFIYEMISEAVEILSDKDVRIAEKNEKIRVIALENVDIDGLGMYTLGNIRKTLDKETKSKYNELFKEYFLKSLTSRLTDYSNQKFEVISADQKSNTLTIVSSKILESSSGPEIKIDWRVYTKNPEKPLIRDLIVEGLSLARTQKEEFSSILSSNNNDINALLKKLEEFTDN